MATPCAVASVTTDRRVAGILMVAHSVRPVHTRDPTESDTSDTVVTSSSWADPTLRRATRIRIPASTLLAIPVQGGCTPWDDMMPLKDLPAGGRLTAIPSCLAGQARLPI
jgi:hypothetical protein